MTGSRGPISTPIDPDDNIVPIHSGTRSADPSPQPVRGIPEPADWVPEVGRLAWEAFATELHRLRLVAKNLDRDFATMYADTYAKWDTIARMLNGDTGMLAAGRHGEDRKHPAMQLYRELSSQLLALQVQAGLTPNSRLRMKAPEEENGGRESPLS